MWQFDSVNMRIQQVDDECIARVKVGQGKFVVIK